jgi:hypothetical protein
MDRYSIVLSSQARSFLLDLDWSEQVIAANALRAELDDMGDLTAKLSDDVCVKVISCGYRVIYVQLNEKECKSRNIVCGFLIVEIKFAWSDPPI